MADSQQNPVRKRRHRWQLLSPPWHDAVRPRPAQPLFGTAARTVLATYKSAIAEPVERGEDFRIIDLPSSGSRRDGTAAICT